MRKSRVLILAVCLAGGAAWIRAAEPPANLLLLTIDTLRADHLGCYGYLRPTSPAIDALAAGGLRFTCAFTPIPLTSPAFAALLTSTYPHSNGAIRNGLKLRCASTTLPEELGRAGYATAAILSNWPLKAHLCDLDRGFDLYDDDFLERRWLLFKSERDGRRIADLAEEYLAEVREPFFLWVHFSEPHAPYHMHPETRFTTDERIDPPGPEGERNRCYDSEILYADRQLARVWRAVEARGLTERTLMVMTADHGESLGEHGVVGHGRRLHQPGCHIPLIFRIPGRPAGVSDQPISLLDLAPTLLSLLGRPVPKAFVGRDLAPVLAAGAAPSPLFLETYRGAVPNVPGVKQALRSPHPLRIGVVAWPHKLIYSYKDEASELYDLERDPGELTNLIQSSPEVRNELFGQLTRWYQASEKATPAQAADPIADEDLDQLRSLGYVD